MKYFGMVLALVLVAVCPVSAAVAPWEIEELPGKQAPAFSLRDMEGSPVTPASLKGKVVLLNFWATWCVPCKIEMPSLNEAFLRYRDRGFTVVGISVDQTWEPVKKFVAETKLSFPILLDAEVEIAQTYKVFAFPTTFLIDRKGIVREYYLGEVDWMLPDIQKTIEKYLDE